MERYGLGDEAVLPIQKHFFTMKFETTFSQLVRDAVLGELRHADAAEIEQQDEQTEYDEKDELAEPAQPR